MSPSSDDGVVTCIDLRSAIRSQCAIWRSFCFGVSFDIASTYGISSTYTGCHYATIASYTPCHDDTTASYTNAPRNAHLRSVDQKL